MFQAAARRKHFNEMEGRRSHKELCRASPPRNDKEQVVQGSARSKIFNKIEGNQSPKELCGAQLPRKDREQVLRGTARSKLFKKSGTEQRAQGTVKSKPPKAIGSKSSKGLREAIFSTKCEGASSQGTLRTKPKTTEREQASQREAYFSINCFECLCGLNLHPGLFFYGLWGVVFMF